MSSRHEHVQSALTAREVLEHFGIKPWPADKVSTYMEEQERAHPGNVWWKVASLLNIDPRNMGRNFTILQSTAIVAIVLFVTAILCAIAVLVVGITDGFEDQKVAYGCLAFAISGVLSGAAAFICFVGTHAHVVGPGYWKRIEYSRFRTYLPPPVCDIKDQALRLFPGAGLEVLELRQEITNGLLDPILVMKVPNRQGKIEEIVLVVWDENNHIVPCPE